MGTELVMLWVHWDIVCIAGSRMGARSPEEACRSVAGGAQVAYAETGEVSEVGTETTSANSPELGRV